MLKDPVCGMRIESDQYVTEYLNSRYAFCSAQCRDRFLANPHLYVGLSGRKAPKQEGLEVLKHRRLRLASLMTQQQAGSLIRTLQAMMGMHSVVVDGDKIEIVYDLLQVTEEQIEAKLTETGAHLGEEWAERLRRAFVHFEEEFEAENLEAPSKRHH